MTQPEPVDSSQRFLQAVAYLIEWVKHIVTIGSALMVLAVAFLKDIVRDVAPPESYWIAVLVVLSYSCMLAAIGMSLSLIRFTMKCVLTTEEQLGKGKELTELKGKLRFAQGAFLASAISFSVLAAICLWIWAIGPIASPIASGFSPGF